MKPERLIAEGWTPRVKVVKGRRYITLRKGARERSLGPYTPGLWKRVSSKAHPSPDKRLLALEERVKELTQRLDQQLEMAEWKARSCAHTGSWHGFRYCRAWRWRWKPSQLMTALPQVEFKRMRPEGAKLWYAGPHPTLCLACTRFMEREPVTEHEISGMYERVEAVEASLNLFRESAKRRVRDDSCGCIHMGQDGYCTLWHYYDRRWDRGQKEDFTMKSGRLIRVWRDNVRKHPEVCASCPTYKPRGRLRRQT